TKGWTKLANGDIHGVDISEQQWSLITKHQGIMVSLDQGKSWHSDIKITNLLNSMADQRPIQLGKLMNDLHTGKALMGSKYKWIWADILAFVLVMLSLTGIYMWWKSQKRKLAIK
ncbi:MAG: PepSY domain-containing protein, partial [Gammaproteobacteria bacterium]|nr:PepSY domain-containing protein [Gammaproteobacteria bacterium]